MLPVLLWQQSGTNTQYLNLGPTAATCRFRLLLGPPTLSDRDLCRMAVKISTWSALLYLAISNLCTRNWRDKWWERHSYSWEKNKSFDPGQLAGRLQRDQQLIWKRRTGLRPRSRGNVGWHQGRTGWADSPLTLPKVQPPPGPRKTAPSSAPRSSARLLPSRA